MTIRPYRPADRDRLRQICRETAAKRLLNVCSIIM